MKLVIKFPGDDKAMTIPFRAFVDGASDDMTFVVIDGNDRELHINVCNANWYYITGEEDKHNEL